MDVGEPIQGDSSKIAPDSSSEYCDIVIKAPCCTKECLRSRLPVNKSFLLVKGCLEEVKYRSPSSKRTYILNKLKHFSNRISSRGYYKLEYVVGVSPNPVLSNVCKVCFQNCYGYEKSTVNYLIRAIKNRTAISDRPFTNGDLTRIKDQNFFNDILLLMKNEYKTELNYEELAMLRIPNTSGAMLCYSWMKYFFNLVGDNTPNSDQIHLEPQTIYEIYAEYYATVSHSLNRLTLKYFYKLWKLCWPHVKIRRYKAVCGKCIECALFCNLRQQCKSEKARVYISALHSYHRITYMGERRCYHERILESHTSPEKFLSAVADTMAQNHMMLPWLGNLAQPKACLPQKMTAVLCHNRCFVGYRFFHNVGGGANASIYCMLRTLERIKEAEGKLPEVFYYQVDGGSENSNLATLGYCEFIVAQRLVDKIVITRLLVGHTHCDIDAFFGVIWKKIRDATILTPHQYEEAIKEALASVGIPIIVEDVFVVPDFQAYINPHLLDITQAFKQQYTKLQWIFEYVGYCEACSDRTSPLCKACAEFPNGVKVTYRAYSADRVYEFTQNTDGNLNIQPECVIVTVEPQARPEYNIPEGMFILRNSSSSLQPAPFITGARQLLELTADKIINEYKNFSPAVLPHWTAFVDLCPETDISSEFIASHPERFHIPLHDELFNCSNINTTHVPSRTAKKRNADQVPTMRTTGSVKWPNRGRNVPLPTSTREYVDGRMGDPEMITLNNCDNHLANYMNWTVSKLRAKCRELSIGTQGTKQVLIDRINISVLKAFDVRTFRGYSSDKNIYVQISEISINGFISLIKSFAFVDSKYLSVEQVADIRHWIFTEARLKLYLKHDGRFFDVCQPDGTCSWQLIDIMTRRGAHNINERDSCLKKANMNYDDGDVKAKLIARANEWVAHVQGLNIVDDQKKQFFQQKASAYISYISNFNRCKKNSLRLKSQDWLHSDAIRLLANPEYPFALFLPEGEDNTNVDYLLLDTITDIHDNCRSFRYDALNKMCSNPNLSCMRDGHAYPLPSSEAYQERLSESIDSLLNKLRSCEIVDILRFHESVLSIKALKHAECNTNKTLPILLNSSEEELSESTYCSGNNNRGKKQASERIDGGYALTGSDGESSSASEVLLKPRKKGEKATVRVKGREKPLDSTNLNSSDTEDSDFLETKAKVKKKKKIGGSSVKSVTVRSNEQSKQLDGADTVLTESNVISNVKVNSKPCKHLSSSMVMTQRRRGRLRDARVKGENKRREVENELDGTLDYSLPANSMHLIYRHVEDKWENKDGVEEIFVGEIVSFNDKNKKYLVHFSTGDDNPVPWEYSAAEIIKIILE